MNFPEQHARTLPDGDIAARNTVFAGGRGVAFVDAHIGQPQAHDAVVRGDRLSRDLLENSGIGPFVSPTAERRVRHLLARPLTVRYMRLLRRRGPRSDPLPGFWPSEPQFYELAQSFVVERDDGWEVSTRCPGHRFVAWELAVRYETACSLAEAHYTQICDGPTDEELTVRIAEIERLLCEADRLSRLELSIRPALPDDTTVVRLLAASPRPQPIMPERSRLEELARSHLPDVDHMLAELDRLRARRVPFKPAVHDFFVDIDREIPGAGIHSAVWQTPDLYDYPFDYEFERVLRPLRYVPAYLSSAWHDSIHVRAVVFNAAAHLEGCIKKALRKDHARQPLGALLETSAAKRLIGEEAMSGMTEFVHLAGNPSKHEYTNDRSRGPVFIYEDAVLAYFLARRFGAIALMASGQLNELVASVENASGQDRYFRGGQLPVDTGES